MSKIYKLYMGRPTEAWHQLTKEEQDSLFAQVDQALKDAGGKSVVACDSSWSSESWQFFGVEEFPDIDAVQKHSQGLTELNWLRYLESKTILGTEWPET